MVSSTFVGVLASGLLVAHVRAVASTIALVETNITYSELRYKFPKSELSKDNYYPFYRSGARVQIGNPPQTIFLTPSLLFNDTIVNDVRTCSQLHDPLFDAFCEASSQGLLATNESTSFLSSSNTTILNPLFDIDQDTNIDTGYADALLATDQLMFANSTPALSEPNVSFVVNEQFSESFNQPSILGLGKVSSILRQTQNSKFSYTGEGPSHRANPNWSLSLGAFDDKQFVGSKFKYQIYNDSTPFKVVVINMTIGDTVLQIPDLSAAVDFATFVPTFIPPVVYYAIGNATNQTILNSAQAPGQSGNIGSNTSVPYNIKDQWNLTITLSNGYKFDVPQISLFNNWEDENGTFTHSMATFNLLQPNTTNFETILGGQFWLGSYFEVDYNAMEWHIAQAKDANFPLKYPNNKNSGTMIAQNWKIPLLSSFIAVVVMTIV